MSGGKADAGMRLLWVAGGRDYTEVSTMRLNLHPYVVEGWVLITGAQRGADLTAETIWRTWEGSYIGIPAKWALAGRSAGPKRNTFIARYDPRPDLMLHFPGGYGTANAVKAAESEGIATLQALLG